MYTYEYDPGCIGKIGRTPYSAYKETKKKKCLQEVLIKKFYFSQKTIFKLDITILKYYQITRGFA